MDRPEPAPRSTPSDRFTRGDFIVGAAIGSGLVARAAERGGADFLLALNAGQLRARGLASIASMLPIGDANAEVTRFARREIAGQVAVPVFAGLSALEPDAALDRRLAVLGRSRVAGIVNFPSVVHYSGEPRDTLEAADAGFARELAMLRRARASGLRTLVYVKTEAEAELAIRIAPDLICINFGWNAGGRLNELVPDVSITEAILRARTITRRLNRVAPSTRVLIEGGPVVHPRQVAEICVEAGTHGYVGGSTFDRLPIEEAIYERALAFKSAGLALRPTQAAPANARRRARQFGLVGPSARIAEVVTRLAALAESQAPTLVSGLPGSQRHAAAQLLESLWSGPAEPVTQTLRTDEHGAIETGILLFGRGGERPGLLERCDGATLRIEPLSGLAPRWQRKFDRFVQRGEFTRYRGQTALRSAARIVFLSDRPLAALVADGAVIPELAETLTAREVQMPRLAERTDDIPDLLAMLAAQVGGRFGFGPSAISAMIRHDWPDQVSDLRRIVTMLQAEGARGELTAADLDRLLPTRRRPRPQSVTTGEAERDWLLEMLRRHGFNRTATARAAGISRKTLYNRLKRHRL